MALIGFVMLYMLATIAIGLYAATRVSSTSDFALAGRSLPLPMVITATFATWFGSETILGLPGRFIESGIVGVIEEPFGSGMALILVGMFFAQKLYKLNILTIGDYYRERYGRGVEVLCTLFIVLSYLGWVGAQGRCARSRDQPDHRGLHLRVWRHGDRHRRCACLHDVRRHVVRRSHRLRADDHHRARPRCDPLFCVGSRGRFRQGDRLRS